MTIHKIQPLLSLFTYALTFTHTLLNSTYYWLQRIPWYDYTICCCCYLVAQPCLILCNPMDGSTLGFPVLHHLPKLAQIHVHWIGAIQPSHPLSPSSSDYTMICINFAVLMEIWTILLFHYYAYNTVGAFRLLTANFRFKRSKCVLCNWTIYTKSSSGHSDEKECEWVTWVQLFRKWLKPFIFLGPHPIQLYREGKAL